jgi:hypothetical protein
MQKAVEIFTEIVINPAKSLATTLTGAATGSIIEAKGVLLQTNLTLLESVLRNGAWLISILVGVCTLYSFLEKQIQNHKKKKDGDA